jgi:predicted nucleic acid-binding Zn ribbon protein
MTWDYACEACQYIEEVFINHQDPMDCPACEAVGAFKKTLRTFSIIQREATKDSSNSWSSLKGKRTTYGKNRAVNGGF